MDKKTQYLLGLGPFFLLLAFVVPTQGTILWKGGLGISVLVSTYLVWITIRNVKNAEAEVIEIKNHFATEIFQLEDVDPFGSKQIPDDS